MLEKRDLEKGVRCGVKDRSGESVGGMMMCTWRGYRIRNERWCIMVGTAS